MKLYRHWVAETREIAGTTFHLRDGSNVSPEDAAAKLERRAAILRASEGRTLSAKESAAVREALLDLGGRTPEGEYEAVICEEVLDEPAPRNAVTRNRYGAEVLNSEDTCFVDVDEVHRRESAIEWIRRWTPAAIIFAAMTALCAKSIHHVISATGPEALFQSLSLYPFAVAAGIVCAVPAIAMARLRRPTATDDAEATLLAKVRALAEAPAWRGLAARVYRTAAGFRILAQADGLAPGNARFRALAKALDADPLYVDLCRKQGCWRARLTPKPRRAGVKRPPSGTRFPRAPEAEAPFAAWVSDYAAASDAYAVCRPVATVGRFVETDVVRLHDDRTRCSSSLPLA
jgi:ribosomal protein S7